MATIQIKSVHFNARESLSEFVKSQVKALEKFQTRLQHVDVTLGLQKDSSAHQNKFAELKVKAKHGEMFSKVNADSFEKAVKEAMEKIVVQTKKMKR